MRVEGKGSVELCKTPLELTHADPGHSYVGEGLLGTE